MVLTSLRCGTFESVSSSPVRSAAHISGNAAFFAPETRTSPDRGTPPWMTSLSIRGFVGGKRTHRKGVDLRSHSLSQSGVDELMSLDPALAAECLAHDERFEVLTVPCDAHLGALESFFDIAANLFRRHHASASICSRYGARRGSARRPPRETRRPPRGSSRGA